ncbi:MAG: multiprotein bridging factor aMBF1 [Candidatus Micrarchaeales archaeon]
MECEICGKQSDALYEISVEGAQMLACRRCAKGGEILRTVNAEIEEKPRKSATVEKKREGGREEIIENYGETIRNAREALGLPVRVLAERISEKESTLIRIEKQKTLPNEKARKKLEKELGIKLVSMSGEKEQFKTPKKDEPVTIWDLAKKKDEEE